MNEYSAEFKIFLFCLALGFVLALYHSPIRSKKRPVLLLTLYLVYLLFQLFTPTEFFPFTAFQTDSFLVDKAVKYYRLETHAEDGNRISLAADEVLPVLGQGRFPSFAKKAMTSNTSAEEFARAYSQAYKAYPARKKKKMLLPHLSELRLEQWKWDFVNDPKDPNQGFKTKVVTAQIHPGEKNV